MSDDVSESSAFGDRDQIREAARTGWDELFGGALTDPDMCQMLTNMNPCGERATGRLVNHDGVVVAATCEAHGNAAEPPWRWERRADG